MKKPLIAILLVIALTIFLVGQDYFIQQNAYTQGYQNGYTSGYLVAYPDGKSIGYNTGLTNGKTQELQAMYDWARQNCTLYGNPGYYMIKYWTDALGDIQYVCLVNVY